jgi:flagellar biosynthetic protein FlhB
MANDNRTEKPTPKRRAEARKKGQAAKSTDLNGAVVLLASLVVLSITGGAIVSGAAGAMRRAFSEIADPTTVTSAVGLRALFDASLKTLVSAVAPVAGACVAAGVVINILQVGVRLSLRSVAPDFARINPAAGLRNTFGPRIFFQTGKALAKVATVGVVAAMALIPNVTHLAAGVGTTPGGLGMLASSSMLAIAVRAGAAYLVIGIADYAWTRRHFERSLRMTRQEVKDEARQYQLAPEVRSAMRRRQQQMARARMMAAVPKADVVVVNPTHFAVALAYDGTKHAPEVVAKGQDLVAAQIRRIAQENDVPIVSDPPLARALHASVTIGGLVPEQLWMAVAQVLAFVYRMAGRRKAAAA